MDLSIAQALIAQAASSSAPPLQRFEWGRWDGTHVYLEDSPDTPLEADNGVGSAAPGTKVLCLVGRKITIIGPSAIPSAGSTGRGSWWRSPDGLQICWVHTTTVRAATASYGGVLHQSRWEWHFPMPFWGQPVAACTTWLWSTGASWGTTSGAPSATSVLLRGIDGFPRTVADPLVIDAVAVGRWRS